MEIILFLIAAGVIFYLYRAFQEYLSGDRIMPNDKDELVVQIQATERPPQIDPKEKLRASEYGIILRILGRLSFADNDSCKLEERLIKGLITDMSQDTGVLENDYLEIYKESKNEDAQELAHLFAAETIGQYKKRLKIIEFMLALSYADGSFTKEEEDIIVDVAAILEIENDDFNRLYDEFKNTGISSDTEQMTREEALTLLGLSEDNLNKEQLEIAYNKVIDSKRQNVLDPRNLNRSYNATVRADMEKYTQAYELLLKSL